MVVVVGGQGGFESRIEVFVIMQKKSGGGPVGGGGQSGGVRRIEKCTKKKFGEGVRSGEGGGVGQGGVERRIEVVMEMPKRCGGSGWV